MVKTNVMRVLDKEKIVYEPFSYSPELTEGVKIAEVLGEDPACVFKTLVTESGDKEHFVFVIPVAAIIFLANNRNPIIGIIASFAAMTSGHGMSLITTQMDYNLIETTTLSARLIVNSSKSTYTCSFITC